MILQRPLKKKKKNFFAPDYFHMIDLFSKNIYVSSHSHRQCTEVSFLWPISLIHIIEYLYLH